MIRGLDRYDDIFEIVKDKQIAAILTVASYLGDISSDTDEIKEALETISVGLTDIKDILEEKADETNIELEKIKEEIESLGKIMSNTVKLKLRGDF